MEIEQLRQEINDLLENVVKHSNSYTSKDHLSSLDVSFVIKKVSKLQEGLTGLKYLLEGKHNERGESKFIEPSLEADEVTVEEGIIIEAENTNIESVEHSLVTKVSEGLTLNDRYLFANELCNKDMNAFNELVKAIDNCSSLDAATKLYSSMDWETDNEHVVVFTNLVERRFS